MTGACIMATNIATALKTNWEELQGEVKKQWGKLTDDDITEINGSYDKLVAKIKGAYRTTESQIKENVTEFLESEDVEGIKDKVVDAKERFEKVVSKSIDNIKDKYEDIKEKSSEVQDTVVDYIRSNPVKSVGIAFVGAFVLSKLFSNK
jgi:uncharacterized protein YjbJ (UPF0337 family)